MRGRARERPCFLEVGEFGEISDFGDFLVVQIQLDHLQSTAQHSRKTEQSRTEPSKRADQKGRQSTAERQSRST
jgi:hypothetical protein